MNYPLSSDIFTEVKAVLPAETVLGHFLGPPRFRRWHCPFHQPDKNPSLTTKQGGIRCWSCGWKGDLFRFLENYLSVDRGESLQIAADLAGLILPTKDQRKNPRQHSIVATMEGIRRESRQIERGILDEAKRGAAWAWKHAWDKRHTEEVWEIATIAAVLDREVEMLEMEAS